MRIMTFNTQHCRNYIKKEIDYSIMADVINNLNADIVALNEMHGKGPDPQFEEQVTILAEKTGLNHHYFAHAILFDGKNPYGNGILSRYPIIQAEAIPIPDPAVKSYQGYYETRCLLKAKLENGVTVLVTHFGLNPDEQENAVKTIVDNIEPEKCILMGDFNVLPDDKVLTPIRKCMKDTADLFAMPLYSYPSDHPDMKIDYIFVSQDIEIIDADIPAIIASDHRPHIATVEIPGI